jgi:Outer membrane protein beta-barrel domain
MRHFVLVLSAVVALSSPALAQKQSPVEFGIDGALSYGLDSPHVTQVSIPVQRLRIGFFVSPAVSIEPSAAFSRNSVSGSSATSLDLGVGALFHLGTVRDGALPYLRPFVEFNHTSFDEDQFGSSSFTSTALGAGVGVKIPIANRFAWRLEGAAAHTLEHDGVKLSTALLAFFGFSFFTH